MDSGACFQTGDMKRRVYMGRPRASVRVVGIQCVYTAA